jgi:hypothetical protein
MFCTFLPSRTRLAPLLFAVQLLSPLQAETLRLQSAVAQNTLLELFTSQGCSSCPPAERWLGRLQHDPRLWRTLIPVAFHVDYWNHLGWEDKLARPAFSARQHRYHQEGALSAVYTPGFVVNGKEWRRGFGLRPLPESSASPGVLTLTLNGNALSAAFEPHNLRSGALLLNIALLGVGLSVEVRQGENAGKRLPQDFVVLEHLQMRAEDGRWQTTLPPLPLPAGAKPAIAAWVSRPGRLTPLQALGGWLQEWEDTAP